MQATTQQLAALFPYPRNPVALASSIARVPVPRRQAGWTHESTESVLELLKDNHQKWHIYFNDRGFHNHASHHLLAIYALGANKQLLEAAYATHVAYMKPAFPPPEEKKIDTVIDDSNWKDYLDDERYYQAYLAFFSAKLTEKSNNIQEMYEKYVMSKDANIVPGKNGKTPMMLSRFMSGLLHPFIHAGYGAEFSLPGLVAEGLAQTTSHKAEARSMFDEKLFENNVLADITAKLKSTSISSEGTKRAPHALTILGRIANDPAFEPKAFGFPVPFDNPEFFTDRVARIAGDKVLKYVEDWSQDLNASTSAELINVKLEEIIWMNSVFYGVAGWACRAQGADEKKEFNADFLTMHLVTSSLLLPSILNVLTPSSAALLLRTYFAFAIIVYIGRGRPALPISDFYKATTALPSGPSPSVTSAAGTLPPQNNPNPWTQIVQTTLVHPNEHLCKLQRALLHFAEFYGGAAPGAFAEASRDPQSAIVGAEQLDGTFFVRVAKLTADRLGWMREGQEKRGWDFAGYYGKI